MLDVKQLRVLKAVSEHGSFSAAAEALSYTQPAISQQIAALEKSAGAPLVDRTSRGVRLTDAGRALVDHAQVVLARLAAAEAELDAIAGVRGGRVRLASFSTASASLLPPALARFTERHPDVELTFSDTEPEDALQMLRAAELEVAVVFEFHGLTGRRASGSTAGSSCTRWSRTRCTWRCRSGIRSPTSRACGSRTWPTRPGSRRATHATPAAACRRRPAGRRASSPRSASSRTTTTSSRGWSRRGWASPCCRASRWPTCARTSWCARSAGPPRRGRSARPRSPAVTARPPPRRCSASSRRWRRVRAALRHRGCRRLTA